MLNFVEIKDLSTCNDVIALYENSFPKEEQVEFSGLFSGVFKTFKLFCLYDDNKLLGMAHFNNTKNFVHLNYLAVDKKHQNSGCGSLIISWIKEKFNNKPIVVDVEELDSSALNSKDRIRRKFFYKKNGFRDGIYSFMWEGVFMTYMHTKEINADEFMKYIQVIFPTIINIKKK